MTDMLRRVREEPLVMPIGFAAGTGFLVAAACMLLMLLMLLLLPLLLARREGIMFTLGASELFLPASVTVWPLFLLLLSKTGDGVDEQEDEEASCCCCCCCRVTLTNRRPSTGRR